MSNYAKGLKAYSEPNAEQVRAWVLHGDAAARSQISDSMHWDLYQALAPGLRLASAPLTDEDVRAIVIMLKSHGADEVSKALTKSHLGDPHYTDGLLERLQQLETPERHLIDLAQQLVPLQDDQPTFGGRVLLAMSRVSLVHHLSPRSFADPPGVIRLFAIAAAPETLLALAPKLCQQPFSDTDWVGETLLARLVLRIGPPSTYNALGQALREDTKHRLSPGIAIALLERDDPTRHAVAWRAIDHALDFSNDWWRHWATPPQKHIAAELAPTHPACLIDWFDARTNPATDRVPSTMDWRRRDAHPVPAGPVADLVACALPNLGNAHVNELGDLMIATENPVLIGGVLRGLVDCDTPNIALADRATQAVLRHDKAFTNNDQRERAQLPLIALATHEPTLIPHLLTLFRGKSKAMRTHAARAYGTLRGPSLLDDLPALLKVRNASARLCAIQAALTLDEPAVTLLSDHLATEVHPELRAALLRHLLPLWTANGRVLGLDDVQRWADTAKPSKLPAWLNLDALPPLRTRTGQDVSDQLLTWALGVQQRTRGTQLSAPVAVLFRLLDPDAAWSNALWAQWTASSMAAKDKWVLTFLGALATDALLTPLHTLAVRWAEKGRGAMAEHIAHTLAVIGSDPALMLLDALAQRFATKKRNVGAAAREAFALAAAARGITPDELGDSVVPDLGFVPGAPRIETAGSKQIRITLGLDGKLRFHDTDTGKRYAKLPSGASPDLKAELKTTAALLRAAMKSQSLRHQNMLVTERHWPAEAWSSTYLSHPLLRAFAVRLVWRGLNEEGTLVSTFRALDDGTLTDADDEEVHLEALTHIALVHPLHLSVEALAAWREHLADHEVIGPFPQLDRQVHRLSPEQLTESALTTVNDKTVASGTLRGRSDRLGWTRGSVIDGGMVASCYRSFPQAGVDAFLMLEGLFMSMDPAEPVVLGATYFVKTGSVTVGSYTYDEPENEADPRVLRLEDVPPLAFSEVMADLVSLAGS